MLNSVLHVHVVCGPCIGNIASKSKKNEMLLTATFSVWTLEAIVERAIVISTVDKKAKQMGTYTRKERVTYNDGQETEREHLRHG